VDASSGSQDEHERRVRFIGGPLDGRDQQLRDSEAVIGRLLRHIHLHEGPKIETHYRLGYTPEWGWQYRLCGDEQH
jgi:hypothetical protein